MARRSPISSGPLWDTPPQPFTLIPHYYAENISIYHLCRLHGLELRVEPRRVFDAVLFSNELDLLEIRWREPHPFVHKFVLLESNGTFTGKTKSLVFSENVRRSRALRACMTPSTDGCLMTPNTSLGLSASIKSFLRQAGIDMGGSLCPTETSYRAHTVKLHQSL